MILGHDRRGGGEANREHGQEGGYPAHTENVHDLG
jgi:hypothetical protein